MWTQKSKNVDPNRRFSFQNQNFGRNSVKSPICIHVVFASFLDPCAPKIYPLRSHGLSRFQFMWLNRWIIWTFENEVSPWYGLSKKWILFFPLSRISSLHFRGFPVYTLGTPAPLLTPSRPGILRIPTFCWSYLGRCRNAKVVTKFVVGSKFGQITYMNPYSLRLISQPTWTQSFSSSLPWSIQILFYVIELSNILKF